MNLEELRENIDRIDDEIINLVEKRMDTAAQIATYKKENNLPVPKQETICVFYIL